MSSATAVRATVRSFARGIHPDDQKSLSSGAPIEVLPTPKQVRIALLQHTGAPCEATVKNRQEVAWGDVVGETDAFVSAPVHASVNGKVARESAATLPNGRHVPVVPITAGDEQPSAEELIEDLYGGRWLDGEADDLSREDIIAAVKQAGIVGLGGAAFPTHVKFSVPPDKPIDTVLVNGCECEPYLTADQRLMLEHPEPIIAGARLAARAVGAERLTIVIEDNKPAAIARMRESAAAADIELLVAPTRYPMGAEKQLIDTVLHREVPTGGLPLDVGVVVVNVGTAAAVARAVLRQRPLTHRVVTVTGRGIAQPKNILAPIGASYRDLVDFCGGLTDDAARAIAGGPMMGFAIGSLDAPVTKGTSGLLILNREEARRRDETPCVRCGRCVDVCPLGLVPTKMALAARHRDWETANRYYLNACCECGCCAFACPAGIPLVQLIRVGKALMPRN